jgi:DNA invertase Pin-like site-specific DNA recombinase
VFSSNKRLEDYFMPKTIGYLRVSTQEQDLEKNKADILKLANDKGLGRVRWEEEKISGTIDWRKRRLGQVISEMEKGDRLIVSELSRLGRSTLGILETIRECREKGISVYAVKGGWELNDTIQSKLLLMFFAMISEIERDLISLRTKEGLAARKAAGVILGRPRGPGKSKLDKYREEIEALLKTGSRQSYIAKKYGCTSATLINWKKKNKISVTEDYSIEVPKPNKQEVAHK